MSYNFVSYLGHLLRFVLYFLLPVLGNFSLCTVVFWWFAEIKNATLFFSFFCPPICFSSQLWWPLAFLETTCCSPLFWSAGRPVEVGMNIDIASIDMVSEVNMVSGFASHQRCFSVFTPPHNARTPAPLHWNSCIIIPQLTCSNRKCWCKSSLFPFRPLCHAEMEGLGFL